MGGTALHRAAFSRSLDACKLLLDAHGDPDLVENAGYTAAQLACARIQQGPEPDELVALLLEAPLLIASGSEDTQEIQLQEASIDLIQHRTNRTNSKGMG